MSILENVQNIRDLLPPETRRQMNEQEAREAKLADQMRKELAETLGRIADALRYPRIAKADLLEAQKFLNRAVMIAMALDPESK
jgi:hypothetical protein